MCIIVAEKKLGQRLFDSPSYIAMGGLHFSDIPSREPSDDT
jgi:hypothetical protein